MERRIIRVKKKDMEEDRVKKKEGRTRKDGVRGEITRVNSRRKKGKERRKEREIR